jgi:integrase
VRPDEEAIPAKTPDGVAELANRARGLSQRHRTMLLLVDGRRSTAQILSTAQAAGVQTSVFDELVTLGMVATADAEHIDVPLEAAASTSESSLLPSVRSLLPESSGWSTLSGALNDGGVDRPLQEARELLMRALRAQAPVSGSLTLMKLKRALTRDDVEALLDEIEQRLRKPHRMIIAAQTMRHVRHLLSLPPPGQL